MVVCNAASVAQSLFRVDRAARTTLFPYPISTIREWISALSIYPFIETPLCCDFFIFFIRYHLDEKENLTMILRGGETG